MSKKLLFATRKMRIYWLEQYPQGRTNDETIWMEFGKRARVFRDLINSGIVYLGIGKLSILWIFGKKKPSNVLEFDSAKRRAKHTRARMDE